MGKTRIPKTTIKLSMLMKKVQKCRNNVNNSEKQTNVTFGSFYVKTFIFNF